MSLIDFLDQREEALDLSDFLTDYVHPLARGEYIPGGPDAIVNGCWRAGVTADRLRELVAQARRNKELAAEAENLAEQALALTPKIVAAFTDVVRWQNVDTKLRRRAAEAIDSSKGAAFCHGLAAIDKDREVCAQQLKLAVEKDAAEIERLTAEREKLHAAAVERCNQIVPLPGDDTPYPAIAPLEPLPHSLTPPEQPWVCDPVYPDLRVEPISKLLEIPNIHNNQIAKMLGFVDSKTGDFQTWKVEVETVSPGFYTEPEAGWRHPYAADRERDECARREQVARHEEQAQRKSESEKQRRADAERKEESRKARLESVLTLHDQGVLLWQIARIRGCTENEAQRQLDEQLAAREKQREEDAKARLERLEAIA